MTESVQERLERIRPPRVKITYDVHTGGTIERRELPFIVGIFADLSGDRGPDANSPITPHMKDRQIVDIDRDNFNEVLKQSMPRVSLNDVDDVLAGNGKLAGQVIMFESLADFEPSRVVGKVMGLDEVFQRRKLLRDAQALAEVGDVAAQVLEDVTRGVEASGAWSSELATKLAQGFPAMSDEYKTVLAVAFEKHVVPVIAAPEGKGAGAARSFDFAVAAIDRALSEQLSAVMHTPKFKELEATWRGLFHVVSRSETGTGLKLRLFNATLQELQDDLNEAVESDQSKLLKLIDEAEAGMHGGSPYNLLLCGYELGPDAHHMSFLEKFSGLASAAHAPCLFAATPELFGLKTFGDLAQPHDLAQMFKGAPFAKWMKFRDNEDSRYVSLVMPRVLLRLPYGEKSLPATGFNFEETVLDDSGMPDRAKFLWGSAAYVLAERVTNAFSRYAWPAAIRGVEGGGLVEGLPVYTFGSGGGDGIEDLLCPTEVAITDRREKELNDLGFVSLCHCKGSGQAAFFFGQTTNKPNRQVKAEANAHAVLSARLPYVLAASRFANYIKVIVRDKIGGFHTRGDLEGFLNSWIADYVLLDDDARQDVKAAYPLREANIVVADVPGEAGAYKATVFLKPHFQLEELITSIQLVADLRKSLRQSRQGRE
jgi:type VI secretion system protein ImpC